MATLQELEDWYSTYYQPQPQRRLSDLAALDPAMLSSMQADNAMGGDAGVSFAAQQQPMPQQMPQNYIQSSSGRTIALPPIQEQGGMSLNDLLNKTGASINDNVVLSDKGVGYRTPYGSVAGLDSNGRMWEVDKPVRAAPTPKQMKEYYDMLKAKAEVEDMTGTVGMTTGQASQKFLERRFGKAPEGRRWTTEGSLENIPGGKHEQAEQKRAMHVAGFEAKAGIVKDKVTEALLDANRWNTGLVGQALKELGGTSAKDLAETVATIKANIGFQELQNMRDASPTGGALGQVAIQELQRLEATLGSLDTTQSEEKLRKNLQGVKQHYDNWLKIVKSAGGGQAPQAPVTQPQAPAQAAGGIPTITSDADFNALPSGTVFVGPDGKRRRKP